MSTEEQMGREDRREEKSNGTHRSGADQYDPFVNDEEEMNNDHRTNNNGTPHQRSKHSDHRSRSPSYYRHHSSSDRKRLRQSPPHSSTDSSRSRYRSRHRSSSRSPSTEKLSSSSNEPMKTDSHFNRNRSHSSNRWRRPSPKTSTDSTSGQRSRSNLIEIVPNTVSVAAAAPPRLASTIVKPDPLPKEKTPTNGTSSDQIVMEEMLLDEREEKPVKNIDLDSLTIPSSSKGKEETNPSTSTPTAPPPVASPTKKPYTLYKVPNTNHTTPSLAARYKKIETNNDRRTSLEERLSTMFGANRTSSNEQRNETRSNPNPTISTPSDLSNGNSQETPSAISTMTKKQSNSDERRPSGSKTYTSQWIATQKPEEATVPAEELPSLPPLVALPTLVSTESKDDSKMLGKLSEAMGKLIGKQNETTQGTTTTTTTTTTEGEDAVPISAKHLEQLERRKEREKRQKEIATIAKEALKPAFKKQEINKEEYKEIMKKVVTRVSHANEIDRNRIRKMIDAYVKKYRFLHQHQNTTKSKSNNGNAHPAVPLPASR